ncbi:MAG TPA: hypothetical protein VGC76_06820 [Pyrinomonadaceae bacterium]|jgi:hypothetical protein
MSITLPSIPEDPKNYLSGEIEKTLRSTVSATCKRCLDPKLAFTDSQYKQKSFVTTCEVLETILIPMLIWGEDILPKGNDRRKVKQVIYQALEFLIEKNDDFINEGNKLCPGDPYFSTRGTRKGSKPLPYTEANAFFISTILHFLLCAEHFKDAPTKLSKDNLKTIANTALSNLLEQFIDKRGKITGWSHTTSEINPGGQGEIYFTWSIIETLVDIQYLREIDFISNEVLGEKINDCFKKVTAAMEDYLYGGGKLTRPFIFTHSIIRDKKLDIYNKCQAFIILGLLQSERYSEMILTLITLVTNSNLISEIANDEDYLVHYSLKTASTGGHVLDDESILPLIVRSIATVFDEYYDEKFLKATEKAHLRNPWSYLVMKDRIEELKKNQTPEDLWGPEGEEYEIYYTERTVEALASCYYYLTESEKRPTMLKESKDFENFRKEYKELDAQDE